MTEVLVTDTGPCLHLSEIQCECLLNQYDAILISNRVEDELRRYGILHSIRQTVKGKLRIEPVTDAEIAVQHRLLDEYELQDADLSIVALACRKESCVVLTDDLKLRRTLETRGYEVVGSVGVLFRAFKNNLLSRHEVAAKIDDLFHGSTLYLSEHFRRHVRDLLARLTV